MVAAKFEKLHLLIADDDPAFRVTVVEFLAPHFQTIQVESGEAALEIVERQTIDIALFDMHMHVLTGLDTIRQMREQFLNMPCILMSSDVTEEMEQQAQQLNAFTVIRKPPQRLELLDTIRCALKL